MTQLVKLFTNKPASTMSLPRGTLQPGAVADITIFGSDHEWIYDVNRSPSKSRNTPFHGHRFRGGPLATIVGGKFVWKFGS
jgi:dihydroorotase